MNLSENKKGSHIHPLGMLYYYKGTKHRGLNSVRITFPQRNEVCYVIQQSNDPTIKRNAYWLTSNCNISI